MGTSTVTYSWTRDTGEDVEVVLTYRRKGPVQLTASVDTDPKEPRSFRDLVSAMNYVARWAAEEERTPQKHRGN